MAWPIITQLWLIPFFPIDQSRYSVVCYFSIADHWINNRLLLWTQLIQSQLFYNNDNVIIVTYIIPKYIQVFVFVSLRWDQNHSSFETHI